MSLVVALVGRPNVGKSTLFNRLIGKRQAIESDVPGTTRDRLMAPLKIKGSTVLLVDTAGIQSTENPEDLDLNVQKQTEIAIEGADLILFITDIRYELTSEDFLAAEKLRRTKKPVFLIVNKCEKRNAEDSVPEFYRLGFGEPLALSALQGYGVIELEEKLEEWVEKVEKLNPDKHLLIEDEGIRLSFVGRPNVGKSTLINALLGEERVVASEVAGTTRDSTELHFKYEEAPFILIDTAGIRRRGKIEKGLEKYSVLRSYQSISDSEISVLLLDGEEGIKNQDCQISSFVLEANKGLILVLNKMDKYKGKEREERENQLIYELKTHMAYLPWAPVVFTSALERKNLFKILELAKQIHEERNKEIPEEELIDWLNRTLIKHPPHRYRGRRELKIHSVKQVAKNPPCFEFYCDWPQLLHFSYIRYLENELRAEFGFSGTSIELKFRRN